MELTYTLTGGNLIQYVYEISEFNNNTSQIMLNIAREAKELTFTREISSFIIKRSLVVSADYML